MEHCSGIPEANIPISQKPISLANIHENAPATYSQSKVYQFSYSYAPALPSMGPGG